MDILIGDARECLKRIPAKTINCCITSPPYYNLRDYGVDGQIGNEPFPALYVKNLVDVFREVKRVLRDDGTLWLNLGYSYAGSGKASGRPVDDDGNIIQPGKQGTNKGSVIPATTTDNEGLLLRPDLSIEQVSYVFLKLHLYCKRNRIPKAKVMNGPAGILIYHGTHAIKKSDLPKVLQQYFLSSPFKPKDLIHIPFYVAEALRNDGWYLRQDIVWHKPNAFPEPVKDRCTKGHEFIFLMAKSPKYYYDIDALREPHTSNALSRTRNPNQKFGSAPDASGNGETARQGMGAHPDGRNKRSVWSINTFPFTGAHFATFPIKLPETCIKAGCPEGGTVLDPFSGAGTTGLVAARLKRDYIGIELNVDNAQLSNDRIYDDAPLFNQLLFQDA